MLPALFSSVGKTKASPASTCAEESSLILNKPQKKPFGLGRRPLGDQSKQGPVAREACLAGLGLELSLGRWEGLRG